MPASPPPAPVEPATAKEVLGCIAWLILFLVCLVGPHVAYQVGGGWWGLAAAVVGTGLYVRLGPPAMPGLLPGLVACCIVLNGLAVFVLAVVSLIRSLF